MPKRPPATAYVRVSSASQTHEMQRHAIAQAARSRGDRIATWYVETMSGASSSRPELAKLRDDARAGRVGRLYVYRLDRLTRSGIREMFGLVETFRLQGVEVVTVADGFDLAGPASDVVLAVLAWAAQMERTAIRERIQAARRKKEARGEAWGRPRRLTATQAAEVVRLRQVERATIREIAVKLHIPKSTVARELNRLTATLRKLSRKGTAAEGPGGPRKAEPKNRKPPLSH